MNQSKIPFAYKTASWVAVGLVVSACSSAPPPESVLIPLQNEYKTLVAKGESGQYYVFCLSVDDEVDLKKAAVIAKEKRIELIHVKELLPLTGYIRGGCSPIGMKKKFKTFVDEMVLLVDKVNVSGGQRGIQICLSVADLISCTEATTGDICK